VNPRSIFAEFWGQPSSIETLGAGHINQTWLVTEADERWVLQQINRRVFVDPQRVMHNIQRVLAHVGPSLVPQLRPTRDHEGYALYDGEVWRVWRFVEGGVAKKAPENLHQARAAGAAYGAFQHALVDLPLPRLVPSIHGFHEFDHYLRRFDELHVQTEWRGLIDAHRPLAGLLANRTGHVHGDSKFENLLFAQGTDAVLAVVDLDTLMPGHWGLDWGDLVRSAFVVRGLVEESALVALAEGFLPYLKSPTVEELVFAPRYVASTLGVRYLIDHVEGDVWFKVSERGENLARAARQFRFVQNCIDQEDRMRLWIDRVRNTLPTT